MIGNTGCLMLYLEKREFLEAEDILDIDETDLTDDGLETEPHVTVIYGLNMDEWMDSLWRETRNLIDASELLGATFNMDEVSIFKSDKYDVIKFDLIESSEVNRLRILNQKLTELFDVKSDFKEYNPHSTLAYVVSGEAHKYVRTLSRTYPMKVTKIILSYKDGKGKKHKISLGDLRTKRAKEFLGTL